MEKKSTNKEIKIGYEDQDIKNTEVVMANSIFGSFRVQSTVPAGKPRKFAEQVVIYTNGATYRLYWFDYKASVWHYVTATA